MKKMKKQKVEIVDCVECKKKVEKADCILFDKVLRTFICRKCFNKDNGVDEEELEINKHIFK